MKFKIWILVNPSRSLGGGVWEACRECGTLAAGDFDPDFERGAIVLCRTCVQQGLSCSCSACTVVVVSPEGDTDGDRR